MSFHPASGGTCSSLDQMGSTVLFSHLNYAFGDCPSFAASPALKSHAWVGHKWVVSAGDAVPAMQRMLFGALGWFFNEKNYYELFIKFSEGLNSESQIAFASVQGKDGCRSLLWVVPRGFLRRLGFKKQNKVMGKNEEGFRCQETAFLIFLLFLNAHVLLKRAAGWNMQAQGSLIPCARLPESVVWGLLLVTDVF